MVSLKASAGTLPGQRGFSSSALLLFGPCVVHGCCRARPRGRHGGAEQHLVAAACEHGGNEGAWEGPSPPGRSADGRAVPRALPGFPDAAELRLLTPAACVLHVWALPHGRGGGCDSADGDVAS